MLRLILLLWSVLLFSDHASASSACNVAFADQWPPHSWSDFLAKFSPTSDKHPLVRKIHSRKVDPPSVADSRFHTLHLLYGMKDSKTFENFTNPVPELEAPQSKFVYIGSFEKAWNGSQGIFGKFLIVRSKQTGRELTVPGFPRRPRGADKSQFIADLNSYLERVESLVDSRVEIPAYDRLFRILQNQSSERNIPNQPNLLKKEPWKKSLSSQSLRRRKAHHRESFVLESFDGGKSHRVAVRETFRTRGLWVTTFDTFIHRPSSAIGRHSNTELKLNYEEARARQRSWLDEIVLNLYPAYATRRGWTQEFIERDYSEVLRSADRTRYILIRNDRDGRPGETLAAMGLNRAPYSGFHRVHEDGWDKVLISAGLSFQRDFNAPAYRESNIEKTEVSLNDLPILKMEKYLGIELNRPLSIDEVHWDTPTLLNGISIDAPTIKGEGVIYEPVKFFLSKSLEKRDRAMTELVAALVDFIFPSYRDNDFAKHGQWLYTFNPLREGTLLYGPRGWVKERSHQPVQKDDVEWHVFAESPEDFLLKFHNLSEREQISAAGKFIEALQASLQSSSANSE